MQLAMLVCVGGGGTCCSAQQTYQQAVGSCLIGVPLHSWPAQSFSPCDRLWLGVLPAALSPPLPPIPASPLSSQPL